MGNLKTQMSNTNSLVHSLGCACTDNIHCLALYIPAYFLSVGILQGDSWKESRENLGREWITTYVTCTGFWVPFMWVNFTVMPPDRRVQFMVVRNLLWNVVIDHLAHRSHSD